MARQKAPPKFLNLLLIKLPPSGLASIAHRLSGVLMFVAVPLLAWLVSLSLENPAGFHRAAVLIDSPPLRLLSIPLVWAFSHHLLAGVRHLLLDIEIGVEREAARLSAIAVNVAAVLIALVYLVGLI